MKIAIAAAFAIGFVIAAPAFAQAQNVTATVSNEFVRVPADTWVVVMNPDPIGNTNHDFKFKDNCLITYGGKLFLDYEIKQPQSMADMGERIFLVTYKTERATGGTFCPSDTIIKMPLSQFAALRGKYEENLKAQDAERDQLRAILNKK